MIRQHMENCTRRDEQVWAELRQISKSIDGANMRWMTLAGFIIALLLGMIGFLLVEGPPWARQYHIEEMGPVEPPEEFLPYRRLPRNKVSG